MYTAKRNPIKTRINAFIEKINMRASRGMCEEMNED